MRIQHRNRSHGLSSSEILRYKSNQNLYTESGSGQTSECSFSSVSTPPIARVGAFFTVFRDLQDSPSHRSESKIEFQKKLAAFSRIFTKFCKCFIKICSILTKFHQNFTEFAESVGSANSRVSLGLLDCRSSGEIPDAPSMLPISDHNFGLGRRSP